MLSPLRIVAAALSLLLVATPALAQTQPEVTGLLVPASTRAAGLGDAYLLSDADADALFYNPALLTSAEGLNASLARFGSGSHRIAVSGGVEWWDGALTFGASSVSYAADSVFAFGEAGLWREGGLNVSEQLGSVSYAQTLFGFRVGGTAKLLDLRVGSARSVSGIFDLGVARALGPVTLGFAAQHLGRDPDLGGLQMELPTRLTASGATRTREMGPFDVGFAGSGSWIQGDFRTAGGGVEVSYWPVRGRTFTARLGYRWVQESDLTPVTFGLGFGGDSIRLDYAFEAIDGGDATHWFTFRIG